MIFENVKVGDVFADNWKMTELTVTELTDKGFKYKCTPYSPYPARYGYCAVTEGELYYKDHPYIDWEVYYTKKY